MSPEVAFSPLCHYKDARLLGWTVAPFSRGPFGKWAETLTSDIGPNPNWAVLTLLFGNSLGGSSLIHIKYLLST